MDNDEEITESNTSNRNTRKIRETMNKDMLYVMCNMFKDNKKPKDIASATGPTPKTNNEVKNGIFL